MTARTLAFTVAAVVATALGTGVIPGPSARADATCRTLTVSWRSPSSELFLAANARETYATGVAVPVPAPGERLTVVTSSWSSYDRYPDWTTETRAEVDQQNERWGISIGGVRFGPLTSDLPDSVAEGAENDRYSGVVTGGFGSGSVSSGEIVIVHASLDGFRESPNSVRPSEIVLVLSYCQDIADTTTTTAATTTTLEPIPATAPTTALASSTTQATTSSTPTTVTPTTAPSTPDRPTSVPSTAAATTTIVPEIATAPTVPTSATSTTITPAGPTLPTTVPSASSSTLPSRLPATGSKIDGQLRLGAALIGLGLLLGFVRRRLVL